MPCNCNTPSPCGNNCKVNSKDVCYTGIDLTCIDIFPSSHTVENYLIKIDEILCQLLNAVNLNYGVLTLNANGVEVGTFAALGAADSLFNINVDNIGLGSQSFKAYNPTTNTYEFRTFISLDNSVTITENDNEIDFSVTLSDTDTNFALNDLVFSGNRVHDLDSNTVFYNNAKQIKSNVNVIQPIGEASYEEKGFGNTDLDLIKRVRNGADELIFEIRGDRSSKFYGNVWSNGPLGLANNTIFGEGAFSINTVGQRNTAFGFNALQVSTASDNSAFGMQSLYSLTTGSLNTAIGMEAGFAVTDGYENTFIGYGTGNIISTAVQNTVVGKSSLTRTIDEVFITSAVQNTYLGADIKSKSGNLNPVNEVVIGYAGVSQGNNSVVLGGLASEVVYIPRLTTLQINAVTGMVSGAMVFNVTLNTLCFYNGATWQQVTSAPM